MACDTNGCPYHYSRSVDAPCGNFSPIQDDSHICANCGHSDACDANKAAQEQEVVHTHGGDFGRPTEARPMGLRDAMLGMIGGRTRQTAQDIDEFDIEVQRVNFEEQVRLRNEGGVLGKKINQLRNLMRSYIGVPDAAVYFHQIGLPNSDEPRKTKVSIAIEITAGEVDDFLNRMGDTRVEEHSDEISSGVHRGVFHVMDP